MTKNAKPKWLEELQSRILKDSSPAKKEAWRQALDSAIPPGLPGEVLTRIRDRFLHDLLVQKVRPLVPGDEKHTAIRDAISGVVVLFEHHIKGESVNKKQWRQAEITAWSAAQSAARIASYAATGHAADAAASYAAWAAARAAANAANAARAAFAPAAAAAAAAWSAAADRAAGDAAAAAFWQWAAEWLLAIIREEVAAWKAAGRPA